MANSELEEESRQWEEERATRAAQQKLAAYPGGYYHVSQTAIVGKDSSYIEDTQTLLQEILELHYFLWHETHKFICPCHPKVRREPEDMALGKIRVLSGFFPVLDAFTKKYTKATDAPKDYVAACNGLVVRIVQRYGRFMELMAEIIHPVPWDATTMQQYAEECLDLMTLTDGEIFRIWDSFGRGNEQVTAFLSEPKGPLTFNMEMHRKTFTGVANWDEVANLYHGEVQGIDGTATYQGSTPGELEKAFIDTIKDWEEFANS